MSIRQRRLSPHWILVVCFGLLLGVGSACGSRLELSGDPVAQGVPGVLDDATETPDTATVVDVGIYGVSAYGLDTSANTFYFSGYLWLRWEGDIDPSLTIEFANAEERGLVARRLMEEPTLLDSGQKLMQMKVQGRFTEPYDLRNYPLDDQQISIVIEDGSNTIDTIVYKADNAGSGYDGSLRVPGWKVKGLRTEDLTHGYSTTFGDTTANASKYSAVRFSFEVSRVRNLFLWKMLMPLLLVLCTNWLALILPPRFSETRTAMPATALLTTMFLQQGSLDAVPQVSTLVLMDLIYLVVYTAIVVTFAQVVVSNLRLKADDAGHIARIRRFDHWSLAAQIGVVVAVLATMILSRW